MTIIVATSSYCCLVACSLAIVHFCGLQLFWCLSLSSVGEGEGEKVDVMSGWSPLSITTIIASTPALIGCGCGVQEVMM